MTDLEHFTRIAHDAYELAAIEHGWETQAKSRKVWDEVPEENRKTMLAAIDEVLGKYHEHLIELAQAEFNRYNDESGILNDNQRTRLIVLVWLTEQKRKRNGIVYTEGN